MKKATKIQRTKRALKGKWKFINYRKQTNGMYPIYGILPRFAKYWSGDIWLWTWRGFAIELDMRTNFVADMTDPNRDDRFAK
jgi:hypothetical protein